MVDEGYGLFSDVYIPLILDSIYDIILPTIQLGAINQANTPKVTYNYSHANKNIIVVQSFI